MEEVFKIFIFYLVFFYNFKIIGDGNIGYYLENNLRK